MFQDLRAARKNLGATAEKLQGCSGKASGLQWKSFRAARKSSRGHMEYSGSVHGIIGTMRGITQLQRKTMLSLTILQFLRLNLRYIKGLDFKEEDKNIYRILAIISRPYI
jgi:hypothetical protein